MLTCSLNAGCMNCNPLRISMTKSLNNLTSRLSRSQLTSISRHSSKKWNCKETASSNFTRQYYWWANYRIQSNTKRCNPTLRTWLYSGQLGMERALYLTNSWWQPQAFKDIQERKYSGPEDKQVVWLNRFK